jgi:hypothetical protein
VNKRSKFKYNVGDTVTIDGGPTEYSRWNGYDDDVEVKVVRLELDLGEPYLVVKLRGKEKRIHQREVVERNRI